LIGQFASIHPFHPVLFRRREKKKEEEEEHEKQRQDHAPAQNTTSQPYEKWWLIAQIHL